MLIFSESAVKLLMEIPMTEEYTIRLSEDLSGKREGVLNKVSKILAPCSSTIRALGMDTLAMAPSGTFLVQFESE